MNKRHSQNLRLKGRHIDAKNYKLNNCAKRIILRRIVCIILLLNILEVCKLIFYYSPNMLFLLKISYCFVTVVYILCVSNGVSVFNVEIKLTNQTNILVKFTIELVIGKIYMNWFSPWVYVCVERLFSVIHFSRKMKNLDEKKTVIDLGSLIVVHERQVYKALF